MGGGVEGWKGVIHTLDGLQVHAMRGACQPSKLSGIICAAALQQVLRIIFQILDM